MLITDLFEIISIWIIYSISISLHEYAHAYASNYFWDPTPRLMWRLTPNPLVHIDLLGCIFIFFVNFWRWKPVQTDPSYYPNRSRDELVVALAWPAVNLVLWSIAALIVLVFMKNQWPWYENLHIQFRYLFGRINMWLAIFNMIPLPPLDGYRIVEYLSPQAWHRLKVHWKTLWIIGIALIILPTPIQHYLQLLIVWWAKSLYGLAQAVWWILLRRL